MTELLRTGDESLFRVLYRRHTPALYALAMRLVGNADDVADIVQDMWVRALDQLDRFAWRSTLRTWLSGILVNCTREFWRQAEPQWTADSLEEPATASCASPSPSLTVDPLDFETALRRLAPRYRAVLVLHDIEGFTHSEIAQLLDISVGTSKSQLARGRARVAAFLHGDNEPFV